MSNEQRYYSVLKRITLYMSPEKLRRCAETLYGLEYPEALEMAYENVLSDAKTAISGRRAPKDLVVRKIAKGGESK